MLKIIGTANLTGETITFDPYISITITYNHPLGKSVFWYAQDIIDSTISKDGVVVTRMNAYIEVWLHQDTGAFQELKIILMDGTHVGVIDEQRHASRLPMEPGIPMCDVSWASRAGDIHKENLPARLEVGKDKIRLLFGETQSINRYLVGQRIQYGVDENDHLCRIELNQLSPDEINEFRRHMAWQVSTHKT